MRKNAHLQAGDVVVGATFAALIDDVGREHAVIHRQSSALCLLEQLVDGALYVQIRPVMVAAEIVPGRDICHRLFSCHIRQTMVQLPEKCDEASEAYKAGYKNICEIGKERIRRAGDKIKSEHPDAKLDTGFRVFRVDESNMEDIYYHPEELTQTMLGGMVSNIKPDRTDLDLLYACLLDWGVEISLSHTQEVIDGCTVHNVDNGALCACFAERVPLSVIDYMAKQQPLRAVFRDSSFAADDSKINVTEIFKNLSPDTKVKVI